MTTAIDARERPNMLMLIVKEWMAVVEEELGKGESGANNSGDDVWKYTNPHGTPRGEQRKTRGAWCAAFLCWCLEAAVDRVARKLKMALRVPIKRTHSARELGRRLGRAGTFIKKGRGTPQPGDVMVKRRGLPGQGHVGLVVTYPDASGRYVTIDGNVGSFKRTKGRVDQHPQYLDDPDLIGWARLGPTIKR